MCVCSGSKGVPEKTVSEGLLVNCEDVLSLSHAAFITYWRVRWCASQSNNWALTHSEVIFYLVVTGRSGANCYFHVLNCYCCVYFCYKQGQIAWENSQTLSFWLNNSCFKSDVSISGVCPHVMNAALVLRGERWLYCSGGQSKMGRGSTWFHEKTTITSENQPQRRPLQKYLTCEWQLWWKHRWTWIFADWDPWKNR